MNFEALSRSSADQYAYNAEGYADPNAHYGGKVVEETFDAGWDENSYAHLIEQLSLAHDDATNRRHGTTQVDEQQRSNNQVLSPPESASSSKDSPPAASLASGRSSSDAHEHEISTPPEPSFEGFQRSMDDARNEYAQSKVFSLQSAHMPSSSRLYDTVQAGSAPPSPELGSPFRPSVSQIHQGDRVTKHFESQTEPRVADNAEIEWINEDVNTGQHTAGKARMMPWQSQTSLTPPSSSGHSYERRGSSTSVIGDGSKPFTRLEPKDIAFSASTLPERELAASECVDLIVSRYPSLCDAPRRQFGEDGQPLPPTKKHETSDEERQARKDAMRVKVLAAQRLSLIKAMVVMESRSATWRRIGPLNAANFNSSPNYAKDDLPLTSSGIADLPPMPSPWSMGIRHEQLDIAQIKGKSKKTIELTSLRTNARCVKSDGSGLGACISCKAEKADECFWCSGTGREKAHAQAWCRRCKGAGELRCNTCHGTLKSQCKTCEGSGSGEYGFFVDVTVKRVEMPAVSISALIPHFNSASSSFEPDYDEVKAAAKLALWDSIVKLTDSSTHAAGAKGGKGKSKEMVPVMAACVWVNSISHIVAVDVPLHAKIRKGASPSLRPEGLHRKVQMQRRFFTVPSDTDLKPVELTEAEVKELSLPSPPPSSYDHSNSGSPYGSSMGSPAMSSFSFSSSVSSPPPTTPGDNPSVTGWSTPTRVQSPRQDTSPAKSAGMDFVHRPSPLSQLAAATPAVHRDGDRQDGIDARGVLASPIQINEPGIAKARRPSAGHVLTKKLSSNILSKLGAHRGSF